MKTREDKLAIRAQVADLFARWQNNVPVRNASEQRWRDLMSKENRELADKYLQGNSK